MRLTFLHSLHARWTLLRAHAALRRGQPLRALRLLREARLPATAALARAGELAAEQAGLLAGRVAERGEAGAAERMLAELAELAPAAARTWRERLGLRLCAHAAEPQARSASTLQRALLDELRQRREAALDPPVLAGGVRAARPQDVPEVTAAAADDDHDHDAAVADAADDDHDGHDAERAADAARDVEAAEAAGVPDGARCTGAVGGARAEVFRLAIDDAGAFAVAAGRGCVLGHLRSSEAELGFLADVGTVHARLALVEDFHGGSRWRLEPLRGASCRVAGALVGTNGRTLRSGEVVELAANLAFRFVGSAEGGSSALLELLRGAECLGAPRVLLLAPGSGGRLHIGPGRGALLRLRELAHAITLDLIAGERPRLSVACAGGLRPGAGAAVAAGAQPPLACELPCPPPESVAVVALARASGERPVALLFAPADARPRAAGP